MIDWKLLAQQKATLVDVIGNGLLTAEQKEDLEGILSLLDAKQDKAAASGENVLFLTEEGYQDACGNLVLGSEWKPGPRWREIVRDVVNSEDDAGCDGVTVIDKVSYDRLYEAWSEVPND